MSFQIRTQIMMSCAQTFKFVFGCFICFHLLLLFQRTPDNNFPLTFHPQRQMVLGELFLYGISFYIKFGAQTPALSSFLKNVPLSLDVTMCKKLSAVSSRVKYKNSHLKPHLAPSGPKCEKTAAASSPYVGVAFT